MYTFLYDHRAQGRDRTYTVFSVCMTDNDTHTSSDTAGGPPDKQPEI